MQPIATRPSLATEAASLIRQEILTGRMRSGDRLVESRLAADLGISRAPVREALKLLHAEGLVGEEPNRGAFVASLTDADVREIYDVRAALEARAARLLARAGHAEDAAALRLLVESIERAASQGDVHALYDADLAFHTTLLELTGNGRLLEVFNRSVPALRALISLDEHAYRSLVEVAQEHWPLVQAIERGDEEVAARYAEQHVEDGGKHVVDRLRSERAEAKG
jgi:GntR family transcriptional regulator, gluconate operon transcriptional repressor